MFRIDDPTAVAALPAPEAVGTPGYFTEGSPGVQVPTNVRASFMNMLQEEFISVLTAAGITPSKTTYNQLLAALRSAGVFTTPTTGDRSTKAATTQMFANEFANSVAANGYQKLPSGLILEWGSIAQSSLAAANGTSYIVTFPLAFPTACYSFVPVATSPAGADIGSWVDATPSLTGASVRVQNKAPSTAQPVGAHWIAIGR